MRGDPELGLLVHLARPHLDLERRPGGPITVVCSERYRFSFGIAMKSLNRPGIGFQSEWMIPSAP